jgi:hypothetical protein
VHNVHGPVTVKEVVATQQIAEAEVNASTSLGHPWAGFAQYTERPRRAPPAHHPERRTTAVGLPGGEESNGQHAHHVPGGAHRAHRRSRQGTPAGHAPSTDRAPRARCAGADPGPAPRGGGGRSCGERRRGRGRTRAPPRPRIDRLKRREGALALSEERSEGATANRASAPPNPRSFAASPGGREAASRRGWSVVCRSPQPSLAVVESPRPEGCSVSHRAMLRDARSYSGSVDCTSN